MRIVTWFFYRYIWKVTIVKSGELQNFFPSSVIIPNGVDCSNFRPIARELALEITGFNSSEKNIIFVAEDPDSVVKNSALAKESVLLLKDENIRLHFISGREFEELPYFYNAADVLLLTSLSEGSANVIKEAMACNCPIVATDVGDIKEVVGSTEGCFITDFDAKEVAAKLELALMFGKRTHGRDTIQHLDSKIIRERIIEIYKNSL